MRIEIPTGARRRMSLFIDPPQWWWHGRNWSHLISDVSLDELHDFARQCGLRYLSFGFDHYDVPEELFDHVIGLGATVVDPRQIVRSLRTTGLRTPLGKSAKRWRRASDAERREFWDTEGVEPMVVGAAAMAVAAEPGDLEVLTRSSELAVAAVGPKAPNPADRAALRTLIAGTTAPLEALVVTPGPWGWAIEVVVTQPQEFSG